MYGAIIGDIAGSIYEFNNIKTKDFPFITDACDYTDDTIMTAAVAHALDLWKRYPQLEFADTLKTEMMRFGQKYPHPMGAYGNRFFDWIHTGIPYQSYGNGAAMRVSACGYYALDLIEAIELGWRSAAVSHDHPEGMKGAEAVSAAIFLALNYTYPIRDGNCTIDYYREGPDDRREKIRSFIHENYYPLTQTLDEIRPGYRFESSCQKTVPQAIQAFLESTSFEDAIRNAISLGGDSDTLAAITGSIAWAYYHHGDSLEKAEPELAPVIRKIVPADLMIPIEDFLARANAHHSWDCRMST